MLDNLTAENDFQEASARQLPDLRHYVITLKADLENQKKLIDLELNNIKLRMDTLIASNNDKLDALDAAVAEARERARDAMHVSVGVDGKNGLRGAMEILLGNVTSLSKDLEFLRQTAHSYTETKTLLARLFTSTALALFLQFAGAIWFVSALHSKQESIKEDLNRVLLYIEKQPQEAAKLPTVK